MNEIEEAIVSITQNIWESILGLQVERARDVAQLTQATREKSLTGCVQLAGAWEGSVFLYCTAALAGEVAATMFGTTTASLRNGDVEDALGELTNMVAGNLKIVLPRPCQLSLPAVVEGIDYRVIVPGTKIAGQVLFESSSQPLLVTVLEGGSMGAKRGSAGSQGTGPKES
ncbi:MAG TPA: chemotaxis protein CheX [Thermoanaerobaculaceae bacterium]|nr:chemotaxis protein CheX [Thermoanaerobaculaceae bacterium]